jgi:hypothetical protein
MPKFYPPPEDLSASGDPVSAGQHGASLPVHCRIDFIKQIIIPFIRRI